ncbi:MAG: hypothetical protein OEV76_00780 [Anaerolineae bacterium]|nr:hypothetical protein [Anaerolineae bacterium]
MTATDIVTAMIALYGAGLSTIIAVCEWRAKRPNIKVEISEGAVQLPLGVCSDHSILIGDAIQATKQSLPVW